MGRLYDLPDPTREESAIESSAMKHACCFDCKHSRRIPGEHGDPSVIYCRVFDEWFFGCDKVIETECDEFEWRKW